MGKQIIDQASFSAIDLSTVQDLDTFERLVASRVQETENPSGSGDKVSVA